MAKSPLALALGKKLGKNDEIQKVEQWIDTGYPPLNEVVSGDLEGGFHVGASWRCSVLRRLVRRSLPPKR
jgi:recombination protein RecA